MGFNGDWRWRSETRFQRRKHNCDSDSRDATEKCEHDSLAHHLANKAKTAGADGKANRQLFSPVRAARDQHIREIRAGKRDHKSHEHDKKSAQHGFDLAWNRDAGSGWKKRDSTAFIGADGQRRILRVKPASDRIEARFRRFDGDAGRSTHHREKFSGVALMQYVVREFGSERCGNCSRYKQLGRSYSESAIEIFRRESDDRRDLSVEPKNLAHGVGRRIEASAPEAIADHDGGRVAGPVERWVEHTSALRWYSQDGKIIGRDQLTENTFGSCVCRALKGDVEWDAGLHRSDASEKAFLFPKLFDVKVRDRSLGHHETLGICRAGQIAKQQRPLRAIDICGEADSESHRNNPDERKSRRLDQRA